MKNKLKKVSANQPCLRCRKRESCTEFCNYRKDWEKHIRRSEYGKENIRPY